MPGSPPCAVASRTLPVHEGGGLPHCRRRGTHTAGGPLHPLATPPTLGSTCSQRTAAAVT